MTVTLNPEDRGRAICEVGVGGGGANDFYFWNMWEKEADKMSHAGSI